MRRQAWLFHFSIQLATLYGTSVVASGAAPWDGSWVLDKSHSHRPDVISLARSPDGSWQLFNGAESSAFRTDPAAARAEPSGWQRRAVMPDARTLMLTEDTYGRRTRTYVLSLSADAKALSVKVQRLLWDGQTRSSLINYERNGPGDTLQGSWKRASAPSRDSTAIPEQGSSIQPPPRPFWVTWTAGDGTITWFLPDTGEVLRGKTDRVQRPIGGPLSGGETFAWKQTAPGRLEFTAFQDGKPAEYAVETISQDGQTFTDTYGLLDTKTRRPSLSFGECRQAQQIINRSVA